MIVVGIDPGKSGAIATLSNNGGAWAIAGLQVMPLIGKGKGSELDIEAIGRAIAAADFVAIEKQQVMPKQGIASTGQTMKNYGILVGVVAIMQIPHVLPRPQEWKKTILKGLPKDKIGAIQYCKQLFPGVSLRASERCKKDHDGIADAICIAHYGLEQLKQKICAEPTD